MVRILFRRWYVAVPVALVAAALIAARLSSADTSAVAAVIYAAVGIVAVLCASLIADRIGASRRRHANSGSIASATPPPPRTNLEPEPTSTTSADSAYWHVAENASWPEADVVVDDMVGSSETDFPGAWSEESSTRGEAPDVAIAIVSNGTVEDLRRCLASIPAAMERLSYQVIVAEDGSNREVDQILRTNHARVVRVAGEAGYAAAVNAIVATADARTLLLLDVNARLRSHSVRRLVEALRRSGAGAVAPRIEGRLVQEGTGAGGLLLSRRCVESFWPLDDSFFAIPSATDLLHRIRAVGVKTVYEPAAVVTVAEPDPAAAFSALARHPSSNGTDAGAGEPDYLFLIGAEWRDGDHSAFQLALKASETRRVLVVSGWDECTEFSATRAPPKGGSLRTDQHAKLIRHPVEDHPNFALMVASGAPAHGSLLDPAEGTGVMKFQIGRALSYLGFRDVVLWLSTATAWSAVRDVPARSTVYDRSTTSFTGSVNEAALIEVADLVIYGTRAQLHRERVSVGGQAIVFDPGIDLRHFDPEDCVAEPSDLDSVPHPRIGFAGVLAEETVDLALLDLLARELPWAHLVVIGDVRCSLASLAARPNVHVLGPRPYAEMPAYEAAFDVAILPWVVNEVNQTTLPQPIKEYLALGLPVVATPFGDVEHFEHLVRTASTHAAFVAAVRRTLHDGGLGDPASRRAAVVNAAGTGALLRLAEHQPGHVIGRGTGKTE
jgi:glycosyltransferase involved in cell wall biosynthesis